MIGPSSYAFFAAYDELAREDSHFAAASCPILSCNLTEIELPAIGAAAEGHIAVGPYFHDRAKPWPSPATEPAFTSRPSSFFAAAYSAVLVLADRLAADAGAARRIPDFAGRRFATPFGEIAIDPQTQHASLPIRIGRVRDGGFDVVEESAQRVDPDPYLSRYDPARIFPRPSLRAVS